MEDRTANVIAGASIINLIVLIIVSRIIFHLTEPFFLFLGASIAAIFAVIGFYFIRRHNNSRRRKMETIIASEDKELRIEYSFLRKVAGLPTKFRIKELEEATDNWKSLIGKGGSATVFKGILNDGTAVAVKRIQHGEERGEKEFRSEIAAIASVQHVNLVRLIGYCVQSNNLHFLVYDFISNGCLSNWIFPRPPSAVINNCGGPGGCLSWKQRFSVAVDVAKALAYLHHDCRSKVLHFDVKPENILLDGHYNAIVADFGISKLMKRDDSRIVTSMRGTRGYIAPEWLLGIGISEKSDVFSYGIVLLELIGGRRSVKAIDVDGDGNRIKRRYEYFPKIVTEKLQEGKIMEVVDQRLLDLDEIDENEVKKMVHIALWCIQHTSRRRPSMVEVVKWLEGRVAVEDPPETKMMVVDLLSIAKAAEQQGEDGGWQNRNKRKKPGVVARVASHINGCLPIGPNSPSTSVSKSYTYSMSVISPR